jgi:hypothetical protein
MADTPVPGAECERGHIQTAVGVLRNFDWLSARNAPVTPARSSNELLTTPTCELLLMSARLTGAV